MIVHELCSQPPPDLAEALDRFEEQFHYPLGPGRSFRIIHGPDYPRFFRAMGDGRCFVGEEQGNILGVVGVALRQLTQPGGEVRSTIYIGDVKIDPHARGGTTLLRLAQAARAWIGSRAESAYSVVMDGTASIPTRYTGRMGIPLFHELCKISIFRLPTTDAPVQSGSDWLTDEKQGELCFSRLTQSEYVCLGGNCSERSQMEPVWLMDPAGRACGRLEDTLRAKRLIADDETEMRSAHLSCFAFSTETAGFELLQVAREFAARHNFPDLFVAVPSSNSQALGELLRGTEFIVAPATVFGTGLKPGQSWNINTAEI